MQWQAPFVVSSFIGATCLLGSMSLGAQNPQYLKSLANARAAEHERNVATERDHRFENTVSRIAKAFETRDADDLESCLARGKIYLSLEAGGKEPGHYGPSQVKFIVDRAFREIRTQSFDYDSRDTEFQDDKATFRADWTYVMTEEDEVVTEHLEFTLEQTKSDWRVSALRTASR